MAKVKKDSTIMTINKGKNSLLDKILANSNSDMASIIDESSFFNNVELIPTDIPVLNLAFSGDLEGGFSGGLITIAGPSRHFKSSFGLSAIKAFQKKYKEGIVIFYDSEGGITPDYFKSFDIDTKRIVHTFVTDVEELKQDMVPQLDGLVEGDPVMFFIDSIGNLSSKREYDNAVNGNTAADMTRAKELKSFTRLINAKLKIKRIPCIAINHTYQTLELYSKAVVGGGTGIMFSSDTVWIIGRSQDKNEKTKEIEGYTFTITIDKSRFVKEKSKFEVNVKYNGGIQKYTGLASIAEELGIIKECKLEDIKGKPQGYEFDGLQVPKDGIDTNELFWNKVLAASDFKKLIQNKFKLGQSEAKIDKVEFDEEV